MLKHALWTAAAVALLLGTAEAAPGFGASGWRAGPVRGASATAEKASDDLMSWLRTFVLGQDAEVKTADSKKQGEGVVGGGKAPEGSQKPAQQKTDEERVADSQKGPQPLPLAF